jgi:hypothetical protein
MKLLMMIGLPFLQSWEEPHPTESDESVMVRRWIHPRAGDGTGNAIHNQAVAAEMGGDLEVALDLSREAYVQEPRRRRLAYIEVLEARIADRLAWVDLD